VPQGSLVGVGCLKSLRKQESMVGARKSRPWAGLVRGARFTIFVGRGNKRVLMVFEFRFMRIIHMDYRKRINCCYVLEQYAINFEIPLSPPFSKGETDFPLFEKEGLGEILLN
jgi:hypothetical protein